jgi:hypothetical protein
MFEEANLVIYEVNLHLNFYLECFVFESNCSQLYVLL